MNATKPLHTYHITTDAAQETVKAVRLEHALERFDGSKTLKQFRDRIEHLGGWATIESPDDPRHAEHHFGVR